MSAVRNVKNPSLTVRRKDAHLGLCASGPVEPYGNTPLFDCVRLVHCAMPELATSDLDLSSRLMGRHAAYPLMITGMTGGTERGRLVNEALAQLADRYKIAFGVGSQRAMHEDPGRAVSYRVRHVAPNVILVGNIGVVQATSIGVDGVLRLADAIEADGIALHLNPAQELVQPEGDRDFRNGYRMVEQLARLFGDRLLVKETGCGIAPQVARRLFECGVRNMDVSGMGGTSWVRVEQLRSNGAGPSLGGTFSGWGIPTAAATLAARRELGVQVTLVASGGVRSGLDVARAIAIGADFAGMALPLFKAFDIAQFEGAQAALENILREIEMAFLLTGSRNITELRASRPVITGELRQWMADLS